MSPPGTPVTPTSGSNQSVNNSGHQFAATVASRRQNNSSKAKQRANASSPSNRGSPSSSASSPGSGNASQFPAAQQVCSICKRDNVSFAKGYALTMDNFARYKAVFPNLRQSGEKGKICATCYNKCYAHHKKAKDNAFPAKIITSSSSSVDLDFGGSFSPVDINQFRHGQPRTSGLTIATSNSNAGSGGSSGSGHVVSGTGYPLLLNSNQQQSNNAHQHPCPEPGDKCMECHTEHVNKANRSIWLKCTKCAKWCHRRCYAHKKLDESLFFKWVCTDCKCCALCNNKPQGSHQASSLNLCRSCDKSFCATCMDGEKDTERTNGEVAWYCNYCLSSASPSISPLSASSHVSVSSPLKRKRVNTRSAKKLNEIDIHGQSDSDSDDFGQKVARLTGRSTSRVIAAHEDDSDDDDDDDEEEEVVAHDSLFAESDPHLLFMNSMSNTMLLFIKYVVKQGEMINEIEDTFITVDNMKVTDLPYLTNEILAKSKDFKSCYGFTNLHGLFLRQVDQNNIESRIELTEDFTSALASRDLIYCVFE